MRSTTGLEVVSEEGRSVEGAGEGASAVGKEGQGTNEGKSETPYVAGLIDGRNLVLCRKLFTATEEGDEEGPDQAQNTAR